MEDASDEGLSGIGGAAAVAAELADVAGVEDMAGVDPAAPALSHGFGGAAGIVVAADADAGHTPPDFPETGQDSL